MFKLKRLKIEQYRNVKPGPDEATIFFEAYEVGIEHVGDILITRGLW